MLICLSFRRLGGAIGLSVSILTVPLFEDFVLKITSGSWKAVKVVKDSGGTIGLSSTETGVSGSDNLLFSDGRRADSFPKSYFILKSL